jgi:hypothetical protein
VLQDLDGNKKANDRIDVLEEKEKIGKGARLVYQKMKGELGSLF